MAGVIALAIDKGAIQVKMKLEKLTPGELSLTYAQIGIIHRRILNEIERTTTSNVTTI